MSNELRLRSNFMSGAITDNPLAIGDGTMHSAELADFPIVTSTDHAAVSLDPLARNGEPEIVWIISHTSGATDADIVRGQENSVERDHPVNTTWSHAPTKRDFESQSFLYIQSTPSDTWVIPHFLGFQPNVSVTDSSGGSVIGDVHYDSTTTLTITFGAAFSGQAYLS